MPCNCFLRIESIFSSEKSASSSPLGNCLLLLNRMRGADLIWGWSSFSASFPACAVLHQHHDCGSTHHTCMFLPWVCTCRQFQKNRCLSVLALKVISDLHSIYIYCLTIQTLLSLSGIKWINTMKLNGNISDQWLCHIWNNHSTHSFVNPAYWLGPTRKMSQ